MYSPLVTDRALFTLKTNGALFERRPVWLSQEITQRLVNRFDRAVREKSKFGLTQDEAAFIRSETILCRHDFRYWAERYGHCNTPDAPIWMADGGFKPLGSINVGDEVMGWQRMPTSVRHTGGKRRIPEKEKLVKSSVLVIKRRRAAVIEVTMQSGRRIRCTPDHLWSNGEHNKYEQEWIEARIGKKLRRFTAPYTGLPAGLSEREAGWLGGIFDGEGSASRLSTIQIAQDIVHNTSVAAEIQRLLDLAGFPWSLHGDKFHILGGRDQVVKFLNIAQPVRADHILRRVMGFCNADLDVVVAIRSLGEGDVVSMQTTTGNYVAWGYASKNCEWDASAGGGIRPIVWWQSQLRALDLIASREEEIHREFDKYGFSDGISAVWHKARQLGATAIMRLISGHRMTLYKHVRSLVASLDEEKIDLIYLKDKVLLDNLPFFLRPKIEFEVKDEQIVLEEMKSRLTYQKSNQKAGVGTSGQFDINHCTEIALWDNPWRLKFDLMPAIPKAPSAFTGWESTANGRGAGNFWYEFTESIRRKDRGFERWLYVFTPWYIEDKKYRLPAPDDWRPGESAIEHAELVERTSGEFTGRTVRLGRDQLYWWETEYLQADTDDTLPMFLTNYCATPEQSFQHHAASAFGVKTIEWMRATSSLKGMPYVPEVSTRVM